MHYRIIEVHETKRIYYVIKKKYYYFWWQPILVQYAAESGELETCKVEFDTATEAEEYIQGLHPEEKIVKEILI